jgi:hypothetical protein
VFLVPVDGGETRAVPGLASPGDRVIQWSGDSRALYVYRLVERPLKIWLLDVETGQKRLWKEIEAEQPFGGRYVRVTPDGNAWVYSAGHILSELYVVEGLR